MTIDEPSKTNHGEITLDLSAAAAPAPVERPGGHWTGRRTEGRKGGREGEGGDSGMVTSPADAFVHLPYCHTKGDTIRVGLKDGGERGGVIFFFPTPWAARGEVWQMGGRKGGSGR